MNMGDYCYAAQQETKQMITNLTRELNTQKELVSHLTQENNGLKKQLNETTLRLSTIMGMKITNDNPDIADLSDDYRPTNLSAMFSELYDNEWTDAFVLLTSQMSETEAIKWLLVILNDITQYCEARQQAKSDEVRRTLLVNEGDTIPDFVLKYIKENRKKRATSLMDTEYKECQARLLQSTVEWRNIALHLSAYTQECFRVCYLMSIQDPPVVFDTLDITHGDTKNYKAYTKVGEKVDFVVWPCLRLCKDGGVLSKGVVQFIPLKESANVRIATVSVGPEIFGFGDGRNTQTKQNEDAEFLNKQGAIGNESYSIQAESEMDFANYDAESNKIADANDESLIEHGPDDNIRTYNQMSCHDGKKEQNVDLPSSASAESCEKTAHVDGIQIPEIKHETVEKNANQGSFVKQMKHNEDAASPYHTEASEKESDHIDFESKMEFLQLDKETRPSLSAIMGMKITNDNPDIPDLSDANRPTKLAEMFSELYDNKWTDAFELLTQTKTDIEAIKCLLKILIGTHRYCEKLQERKMEELKRALLVHEGDTISDFVLKYIKENRNKGADSLLETEYKVYEEGLSQSTVEWRDIARYTQECFRVCYLMSIQDPPVVFDTLDITRGDPFDTKKYKVYTKSGVNVDFMVWPCLLLCKYGRVLSKGIVQCFSSLIKSDRVRSAPVGGGHQRPTDAEFLYQPATSRKEETCIDFDNQLESVENNETCDQVAGTKDKSFIRDGTDSNNRTDVKKSSQKDPTEVKQTHQSSISHESFVDSTRVHEIPDTAIKSEAQRVCIPGKCHESQITPTTLFEQSALVSDGLQRNTEIGGSYGKGKKISQVGGMQHETHQDKHSVVPSASGANNINPTAGKSDPSKIQVHQSRPISAHTENTQQPISSNPRDVGPFLLRPGQEATEKQMKHFRYLIRTYGHRIVKGWHPEFYNFFIRYSDTHM